jgi:hypothetical protein
MASSKKSLVADVENKFFIYIDSVGNIHSTPLNMELTRNDALNLAAWIVSLADPIGDAFNKALNDVQGRG